VYLSPVLDIWPGAEVTGAVWSAVGVAGAGAGALGAATGAAAGFATGFAGAMLAATSCGCRPWSPWSLDAVDSGRPRAEDELVKATGNTLAGAGTLAELAVVVLTTAGRAAAVGRSATGACVVITFVAGDSACAGLALPDALVPGANATFTVSPSAEIWYGAGSRRSITTRETSAENWPSLISRTGSRLLGM